LNLENQVAGNQESKSKYHDRAEFPFRGSRFLTMLKICTEVVLSRIDSHISNTDNIDMAQKSPVFLHVISNTKTSFFSEISLR
jgi:hypothetical protein